MKEKCSKCNNFAKWMYMPSEQDRDIFYCNKHVPRGCSCNCVNVKEILNDGEEYIEFPDDNMVEGYEWQWVEKDVRWEHLFEGKQIPCCEYWYFEEGIEKE